MEDSVIIDVYCIFSTIKLFGDKFCLTLVSKETALHSSINKLQFTARKSFLIPSGTDKELLSNFTKRNAHKSKDLVKVYKIRQLDVFFFFFCRQTNGMID